MKLHIGGWQKKEGWSILDALPGPNVDYIGTAEDLSQFADQTVECVYASHVLEHVRQADINKTLRGIHRILKTGGTFMVSVPDLGVLCHLFINPCLLPEQKHHVLRMIYGGQTTSHDFHYFGYNSQLLAAELGRAGFSKIEQVTSFGIFKDTSELVYNGHPISLNVRATK